MNCLSRCLVTRGLCLNNQSFYFVHRRVGRFTRQEQKSFQAKHFILLLCPLTAFGLGYWQIQRRRWKLDVLDKINTIMPSPPILLHKNVISSTDLPEFQPIIVEGRFDHSREVIVGPRAIITDDIPFGGYGSAWGSKPPPQGVRTESNLSNFGAPTANGYLVVTPFELKDRPGQFILVNRGFVPTALRDPCKRKIGQIEGNIKIVGYIRYNEKPPPFTPDPRTLSNAGENQAPHHQFFSREVIRISEVLGTLPIFIDGNYESTVKCGPIGGQTKIYFKNDHLTYVFTWFSMGAFTLGMWAYWLFF